MFSTNSTYKFRTSCAAFFYCHLNKLSNTILVENLEWVNVKYLLVKIYRQEAGDIVAAVSKCHLCQVVSSKAKVFCFRSNVISC